MISNDRFNRWLTRPLPAWCTRSHRALPTMRVRTSTLSTTPPWHFGPMMTIRPLIAVAAFVITATHGWWLVALPLVGLVYGTALTCVHHLIHSSLGLTPRARHFWLRWIGLLVVESGHALQVTHLAHHRGGADVPDPEGSIENATWREMPFAALAFRYRLMTLGLKMAPAARRPRIVFEVVVHAIVHIASLALLPVTIIPWMFLTMIHVSSFAFAILAGKGPQTNYGRSIDSPFVRVHTSLGRLLFFSHDQHLEHHAAPKVPLPHLRRLQPEFEAAFADLELHEIRMPL